MGIPPDKVMDWLRRGGYPLEYEAARQLRIAGFYAEQGRHYTDPLDPTTNRETDVVATALLTNDVARVILVAECKVSNDKPWVVLTSPTRPEPWPLISRGTLQDFLAKRPGLILGLLPQDKPYGFSVVETMRDTKAKDRAHDALDQVVSATIGIMKTEHGHVLLWPVVVTTAQLFRLVADGVR